MRKVLITGYKGYIGSNLTNYLIRHGYFVDGVDIKTARDAMYYPGDEEEYDGVIHLSAIAGIQACEDRPLDAIRENVNVAERVFSWNKKTVFLSSQAAKTPTNVYALTKALAERIALYKNKGRGDVRVLRLSNVYGGKNYVEYKSSVVAKFIRAYTDCRTAVINGTGKQKRDFINIKDVCKAIMIALEYVGKVEKPVDIGTGRATNIKELVEMFDGLKYEMGGKGEIGVDSNIADITKAREIFGFEPKIKLEDYIHEYIEKNRFSNF